MGRKEWITSEYRRYLKSDVWKKKRIQALESAKFRCKESDDIRYQEDPSGSFRSTNGKRYREIPACDGPLEVHHRFYPTILGEESVEDLIVLCRKHHESLHHIQDSNRLDNARLDGWASKKYGDDWDTYMDPGEIEQEFQDWLYRKGYE